MINIKKLLKNNITLMLTLLIFLNTNLYSKDDSNTTNLCMKRSVVFGFFNGVNTTRFQAQNAVIDFIDIFGAETDKGEYIDYQVFYNYTQGLSDFVETFEQRLKEQDKILQDKYELYFQAFHNKSDSWIEKIKNVSSAYAEKLGAVIDEFQAKAIRDATKWYDTPPSMKNYKEIQSRLDNYILEGKKLLFFAHSQGNLFANMAYKYATSKTSGDSVKVVHVAPASPILHGDYTLADKDLVINGLRIAGSVPDNTNSIPGYFLRKPGIHGGTDLKGHGLFEIYLNPNLTLYSRITNQVKTALNTLIAPKTKASQGFFTVILTWDGAGDIDLHIDEPDNTHVYYGHAKGTTGYLDVDNMSKNGPEHYYASCMKSNILLGEYIVKVANYNGAKGRNATVQVASSKDGVMATKTITLGNSTGDTPSDSVFKIEVTDLLSDTYDVILSQW